VEKLPFEPDEDELEEETRELCTNCNRIYTLFKECQLCKGRVKKNDQSRISELLQNEIDT
jgi:hypothetical protein